ncbi:MAG: hypothetical protein JW741_08880, partial [Sedimentisphaerales bacterium]|nr:hypothetical protein [Sedimentisphaerales bacterium]
MKTRIRSISCISALLLGVLCASGCHMPTRGRQAKLDRRIETGAWRVLADVPVGRFGGAAAVVKGRLHLFGGVNMNPHTPEGQDKAQAVNLHHVYEPATDTWWEAAPMPDKKGWPAIAVYRNKIYIFGGDNQAIDRSMTTESWVYDPET